MSEHIQHGQHGNGQHQQEVAKQEVAKHVANLLTTDREYKFSFKKQMVKDELGMEIKRPPVTLNVPVPTFNGLVDALDNEKVASFVLDLVEEAIKDQVRSQLSDEEKPVNRQEDLDISKLTLQYIANMPKSERTGGGISKDTWADWEKDYIEAMAPIRTLEKATKAAKLFVGRFAQCRTDKPVLQFLRTQLATWATETKNLEEYGEVFQYLDNRATDLINRDSVSQLESL